MARSVASGQPRPLDELTVIVALSEIKEAALSKEMNSARDTWEVVASGWWLVGSGWRRC